MKDTVEGEDAYIYYQMNDKDQLCLSVSLFLCSPIQIMIFDINKFEFHYGKTDA